MSTARTSAVPPSGALDSIRLPETPEPKDMTTVRDFYDPGHSGAIREYLGHPETTMVRGDLYLTELPFTEAEQEGHRYPDLMIAFGVDPQIVNRHNGYVIAYWGKPPEFVLEVASVNTARIDHGAKRGDYSAMGIQEYWRFDADAGGSQRRPRLVGDRLAGGSYEPIPVEQVAQDEYRGYSAVLDVNLCWRRGEFRWQDPRTGEYLRTRDEIRADEIAAQQARADAESRADDAESRAAHAEAEVRRLRELLGKG